MFYSIHFKPRALKDLKAIERKKVMHRKTYIILNRGRYGITS